MKKFYLFLLPVCCLGILFGGIYFTSIKKDNIKVKVDGIKRTINLQGKTFEQICKESSGIWGTADSMGISEMRDGVSISVEKCSGCMPDSKNMFCEVDDYISYVKENGVNTQDLNIEMEK